MAGEGTKVFTREDIWIKPLETVSEPSPAAAKPSDLIKAYARGQITCNFREGEVPQLIEIVFEGAGDIDGVELLQVAGGDIPAPVRPSQLSRIKEGYLAQFEGWTIARFLRPGEAGNQIAFRLRAPSGTVTMAQANLKIVLKK